MLADEGLSQDLNIYLQELGKNITAEKVVQFLNSNEVRQKHGITKTITIHTVRCYLQAMGYRFSYAKKGQYCDGHKREDIVWYWQHVYCPTWEEFSTQMQHWSKDGTAEQAPPITGCHIIIWFHDETIFYAHDHRWKFWSHKDKSAEPYWKGDEVSLMVADYISADFGWLVGLDGKSARKVMRPGKSQDGYFTHKEIDLQAHKAMDIIMEAYPEFEHVFVYNNATTHRK
jgi:hypothetical protein